MRLIVFLLFIIVSEYITANKIDSLYVILDKSIKKREYYFLKKESKLYDLKTILENAKSIEEKFSCNRQLMDEYSYYISDSALYYSKQCLLLAKELNNNDYQIEIQLKRAYLLSFPELFIESFNVLKSINPNNLSARHKIQYYYTYILVYNNQIKGLNDPFYRTKYKEEMMYYINEFLSLAPKESLEYLYILAFQNYQEEKYEEATRVLNLLLKRPDIPAYAHAEYQYKLGETYREAGPAFLYKAKENLIIASIEFNKLSITKNPALLSLATLLIKENDTKRAYDYINLAMYDIYIFNNKYHKSAAVQTYSAVQEAYLAKIESHQSSLHLLLAVLGILFLSAIAFFIYILRQNSTLKIMKSKLAEAYENAKEINQIKAIYIGHYLDLYSSYISKMDDYHTLVQRKIAIGRTEELSQSHINTIINIKKDINDLFTDFDAAFLQLYPNFIQQLNELLTEKNRYALNHDKSNSKIKLNTEIRILALLRLDISDNKKISSFLRITIQSVYNYRSKIKAKAINENTFEEDIKKIGL